MSGKIEWAKHCCERQTLYVTEDNHLSCSECGITSKHTVNPNRSPWNRLPRATPDSPSADAVN